MKFNIDENLPVEIAGLLRAVGYDAMTVIEQELRGANSVVGAVTACHSLLSPLAQEGQALGYGGKGFALRKGSYQVKFLLNMNVPRELSAVG